MDRENVPDSVILMCAKIAHEVNRRLKQFYGEEDFRTWDQMSENEKNRAITGVRTVIQKKNCTPQEIHNAWMDSMRKDGWVYGPHLDTVKRTNPNLVPYMELPDAQKLKDHLYLGVITSMLDLQ